MWTVLKRSRYVFRSSDGRRIPEDIRDQNSPVIGDALVARLGDDEFSILLRHADESRVRALAGGVLQAATQEVAIGEHLIKSGISIGIAFFPRHGMDAAALLANADAALYRAKQDGRGSIPVFDSDMDRQLRDKRLLVKQLRPAIERDEFELHYQPQICRPPQTVT
jgi:predicted signal transduction protein with EAL and GGDEF domain